MSRSSPDGAPSATDGTTPPQQDANGVDLTLVRRMLALTPLERLREHQAFSRFVARVRARNPQLGPEPGDVDAG